MNLINHWLYLQTKRIARGNRLEFDANVFNYSHKWLLDYKKAYGINMIAKHGEDADADLGSVSIVKIDLPPLLAKNPLEDIYNFDERLK